MGVFDAFNANMSALGDQVRELGETTGSKTVPQMTTLIDTANSTIDSQATLLDQAIAALQGKTGGITPSGSITITENGTYDVTDKASAAVNVSGGAGETVTVTIGGSNPVFLNYLGADGIHQSTTPLAVGTVVSVVKNSMIVACPKNHPLSLSALPNGCVGLIISNDATTNDVATKGSQSVKWNAQNAGQRLIAFVTSNITLSWDVD